MKIQDSDLFEITVAENGPNDGKKARRNGLDYNDHKQLIELMSKHLAKIFIATHKEKVKKELDKIKANCK